ncbi:MAG TPA: amino acid racemase [Woeseiaceae bacterium]|nr:amino acid racemase [Woeseiaceae bacterium]
MKSNELTVGVLGGMGPDATIDFMSKVVALSSAKTDQDHIRMLVDHNPKVPNRQAAILEGGPDPGPELAAMARRLEQAGADFLVMACNSAHAFLEPVREAITIPFVSIIEESIGEIETHCPEAQKVGIMATDGMLATGIYQKQLSDTGRAAVVPREDELARLMALIRRVKAGDRSPGVADEMGTLAELLASAGAEAIIAACTEIPLVLDAARITVPVISSTDVLARRTIALARGIAPLPQR